MEGNPASGSDRSHFYPVSFVLFETYDRKKELLLSERKKVEKAEKRLTKSAEYVILESLVDNKMCWLIK